MWKEGGGVVTGTSFALDTCNFRYSQIEAVYLSFTKFICEEKEVV